MRARPVRMAACYDSLSITLSPRSTASLVLTSKSTSEVVPRQGTAYRQHQRTSSPPELRAKDGAHQMAVVAAAGTLVHGGQHRLDGRGTRDDHAGQVVEGRRQVSRRFRDTQFAPPR